GVGRGGAPGSDVWWCGLQGRHILQGSRGAPNPSTPPRPSRTGDRGGRIKMGNTSRRSLLAGTVTTGAAALLAAEQSAAGAAERSAAGTYGGPPGTVRPDDIRYADLVRGE